MANMHEYPVTVRWTGGREGSGEAKADRSGYGNPISVPPEFNGPGNGTNPEELLATAVASCYSITYGIIAANRKLPYLSLETKATGFVAQEGATFTYTKIVLNPTITVATDATAEQLEIAEDIAHKADLYCIITNTLRGKVQIEINPHIVKA